MLLLSKCWKCSRLLTITQKHAWYSYEFVFDSNSIYNLHWRNKAECYEDMKEERSEIFIKVFNDKKPIIVSQEEVLKEMNKLSD